jgi:hypothetical protein
MVCLFIHQAYKKMFVRSQHMSENNTCLLLLKNDFEIYAWFWRTIYCHKAIGSFRLRIECWKWQTAGEFNSEQLWRYEGAGNETKNEKLDEVVTTDARANHKFERREGYEEKSLSNSCWGEGKVYWIVSYHRIAKSRKFEKVCKRYQGLVFHLILSRRYVKGEG